ncbi:hypothetical protein I2F27_10510 [Acinetobacter sp. B5B]|uniref:hypothetical protein n=1 Tax=Acinetobacter baretiae TaxID=2605383 RepID=UPI0018C236AE|nr:hypothetical protein [Acinetobacter baretiae]MBF7683747.1 hypothetical protein [Acinetobacter baretiae]MBF7685491.1 hypothetical protein [Acinetobacter baretiae]
MKNMTAKMVLIGMCCLSFSACQTTPKHLVSKQVLPNNSTVKIFCDGAKKCEFERVNHVRIVNETTHLVDYDAIQKGYVRLQLSSTLESNHLYLTIPAQQQEIVIRFYPISLDRAEKINVIHQFKPNQNYTFSMYRDRIKRDNNLLSLSTPDPLCVKLLEGQRVIRRFCKPYNVLTGLGEFVEQKNDFKSFKD